MGDVRADVLEGDEGRQHVIALARRAWPIGIVFQRRLDDSRDSLRDQQQPVVAVMDLGPNANWTVRLVREEGIAPLDIERPSFARVGDDRTLGRSGLQW